MVDLSNYVPTIDLSDINKDIPKIAADSEVISLIAESVQKIPTRHVLIRADSTQKISTLQEDVGLVLTSPPYWTLKRYAELDGQLGHVEAYEDFLMCLERVFSACYERIVPGGRLVCVVGDVCLSRKKNNGRHTVVPLHSDIIRMCIRIGYDNLTPIYWYKVANISCEAKTGGSFLGKPYEPGAIIKNDVEHILMLRKPGYRQPSEAARLLSLIPKGEHHRWFKQVWSDVPGESSRNHPAPFPEKLAARIVRMFSFVGDTVLDPFLGSGTTSVAAARFGRNSVGLDLDPNYMDVAKKRLEALPNAVEVKII